MKSLNSNLMQDIMNASLLFDMLIKDIFNAHTQHLEHKPDRTKLNSWMKDLIKIKEIIKPHLPEETK